MNSFDCGGQQVTEIVESETVDKGGTAVLTKVCPLLSSMPALILSPPCVGSELVCASSSGRIWTSLLCGVPGERSEICSVFCSGKEGAERAVGDLCTPANY